MAPFGLKFSSLAFSRAFVANHCRRWLQRFFDGMGLENHNILRLVEEKKGLSDFVSHKVLAYYRAEAKKYAEYGKLFSDDDVYSFLPDELKLTVEDHPQGKEWAYRQIEFLRSFLFPS